MFLWISTCFTNSVLDDLDESEDHQDEQQRGEGVTLDDAICESDFADFFLRPV